MTEGSLRRILLLGASGRVGRLVLHHWQRNPGPTTIVPQFRRGTLERGLIWDPMVSSQPLIDNVRQHGHFHTMVILAGVTPGAGCDLALNTLLAQACLEAASHVGIRRVLLASSSAVYGTGNGSPFDEGAVCNPINEYGASKKIMEQDCERFRNDDVDLCYLRIGNVAGADALLMNIARAAPEEPVEIDIFTDGRGPVRSYIGVKTMVEVLQSLCMNSEKLPSVLNLAAPYPVSMERLAKAACHPWTPRIPAETACQTITLNCSALSVIHTFKQLDSNPEEMVKQWEEARR